MRYVVFCIVAQLACVSAFAGEVECAAPCERASSCDRAYYLEGGRVVFYSNYPLDRVNDCIEDVIFVIHGSERNPRSRFQAVYDAARSVGRERQVLVISPFLKTKEDSREDDDIYWTDSGWKQGNTSIDGRGISSFTVVDRIFKSIVDSGHFSNAHRVTVTGHSAGGQYAQMFALTSGITHRYPTHTFQFLVLNPSNYTYLNENRPHPFFDSYFELPVRRSSSGSLRMKPLYRYTAGNCPSSYNDYKYGLYEKNLYASTYSDEELITQYLARNVYYFLGELDNDPNDPSLDDSCSAEIQGSNRLDRGIKYFNFLNAYYEHNHQIDIVDSVGHDARLMYNAPNVKMVLFSLE